MRSQRPAYSIPSILAVIAAIASFFAGAMMGFILAIAAIVLGVIGLLMSFAPGIRGGVASIVSILAGAVGIVAALFKLVL